jgi:uncharacterized protein (DUF433 family)
VWRSPYIIVISSDRNPIIGNDKVEKQTPLRIVIIMPTATDIGTLVSRSTDQTDGDRPMVAGTRTSVARVVVLYKQGANAEEIARRMSHLSLAQIYAALAYYHANRDEIETDLAEEEAEYWRLAELHSQKA